MTTTPLRMGTVFGVVLAGLGIIAPILWDRYKTRSALELRELGNSVIVSPEQVIEKLEFLYNGEHVPSLSKLDFALVNTGRTPIRSSDVVAPPTLRLSSGRILDFRLTKLVPENLAVTPSLDPTKQAVSFSLPLQNPGDALYFSLFITPGTVDLNATARIAGIGRLDYLKLKDSPAQPSPWARFPGTARAVALVTVFCAVVALGMLFMFGEESAIASLSRRGGLALPATGTAADYSAFLDRVFETDKRQELKPVRAYLDALPSGHALDEQQRQEFSAKLNAALADLAGIRAAFWVFVVPSIVGAAYVATSVAAVAHAH